MSGLERPPGSRPGDRARRALYQPPPAAVARRLPPRAAVLLYHRVAAADEGAGDPYGQAVPPERFAEHLALLARRYRVAAAGEIAERLARRERLPDGTVAVTFDDGYADNLEAAAPIATRLGVPLAVFVAVEPVLGGGAFWWDELAARRPGAPAGETAELHARLKRLPGEERRRALAAEVPPPAAAAARDGAPWGRPLTAAELARLAAVPGVEIGSHTLSHPSLAALPEAEQLRELAGSRARLAALAGRPVRLLAYPFGKSGDVSAATRRLARQAGYLAAFTSEGGRIVPTTSRWALPRLPVHDWPAAELERRLAECFG